MRLSKVMIIFRKEYDDILKSRYIFFTLLFLPFFMLIVLPLSSYLPVIMDPEGLGTDDLSFLLQFEFTDNWQALSPVQQYFIISVEFNWLYFFIVPVMLPSVIAADSFTGEKDRGTVEGLLAAPITESELYAGKIATSLIPTVLSMWFYTLPYMLMTNFFSQQILGYNYLPTVRSVLLIVVILPLTSFISINLMIWASTRTSTTRDAQQLGGLILLPLIFILLNIVVVALFVSDIFLMLAGIILLLLSIAMTRFGLMLLDREKWLSQTF